MRLRIASAGTGKTTSLVARYLELIGAGVPLRRIAGVTFTRAAAAELQLRLREAILDVLETGEYLGGLYCADAATQPRFATAKRELPGAALSTIHGFMSRALRLNAPLVGLTPDFQVVGEWDARLLFEEEYRAVELLTENLLFAQFVPDPDERARILAELFQKRSLAANLTFSDDPRSAALAELYERVRKRYRARLAGQLLSPSEIEESALAMLNNPAAVARVVQRFPVVLVDEYQDVNPVQGTFFAALAETGAELEVVGDPKQSIYGFRNAEVAVFRRAAAAARQSGAELEPLRDSRRHAPNIANFLNILTAGLGGRDLGFSAEEAPPVHSVGYADSVTGNVQIDIVEGSGRLAQLRNHEARIVAERIRDWAKDGMPLEDIAVLGRSYNALKIVQDALAEIGVPALLLQGRGYYRRSEIRDLFHALQVGVNPNGASLAPFLRSPFAQLHLPEFAHVFSQDEPLEAVVQHHPEIFETITALQDIARKPPLEALTDLIRKPLARGKSITAFLSSRERENVDQLVFEFAQFPPIGMELLLYRLIRLSEQTEAGDVPQSGSGVRLQTIHSSKGLEYRAVAVFDAGGFPAPDRHGVIVDTTGAVHLPDTPGFSKAQGKQRVRSHQELFRLLYVAVSRPREQLLITGSIANENQGGWIPELLRLPLADVPGVTLTYHNAKHTSAIAQVHASDSTPSQQRAPWAAKIVQPGRYPPLMSPSRVSFEEEQGEEPLPLLVPGEEELPMSRGSLIGTLFHYAAGQNWNPDDPVVKQSLRAQELMFAYEEDDQEDLTDEIVGLLREYTNLIGHTLPALPDRTIDRSEVPVQLAGGDGTVWEGIIDRLYQVDGQWFIDDYKTDRVMKPERYFLQLGMYTKAARSTLGGNVTPRLVYVRHQVVREVLQGEMNDALERAGLTPM